MTGAHLGLAKQQLRRLAVRQCVRQLYSLRAASDQRRDEGLLLQVAIIGAGRERVEKLRSRRLRVRLAHGKPACQILSEHPGQRIPTGHGRSAGRRRIGCRTGGQQRNRKKKWATDGADLLHLLRLRHARTQVMRI